MQRDSSSSLFDTVRNGGYPSISIIGLAKNVGKTTTLNYLIGEIFHSSGIMAGLSSAGWDGESYDSITGEPKPKIIVPEGFFVATTADCLSRSPLPYSVVEKTGIRTPLGEVLIIQAEGEGSIEIAGPSTISELIQVRERMKGLGCNFILFDGAINRKASSAPSVCDGVILATGANAGYHLEDVKKRTSFALSCYALPPAPHHQWESSSEKGFMVLDGALTDEILEGLIRQKRSLSIVIEDASKLFLSPEVVRRWKKLGGQILLQCPSRIVGVTVNPTAISGKGHDAPQFLKEMAAACAPYPVWDVVLGKGMNLDDA